MFGVIYLELLFHNTATAKGQDRKQTEGMTHGKVYELYFNFEHRLRSQKRRPSF